MLLVKNFFVCRPIDTRDSEVDTRKPRFWCVEIENRCVTSSDTANICCVRDTACPAKETIFSMCRHFSEKLFSCGHGVSSLRISLKRKDLERQTGFLNHLTMTFDDMTPFRKGFYLTLNSWRSKLDKDDWKMSDKTWMQCLVAQLDNGPISEIEFENQLNLKSEIGCPQVVTASTRLSDDVRSLMSMFSSSVPPKVNLRSKEIVTVVYGFGDASGTGLGPRSHVVPVSTFGSKSGAPTIVENPQTGENSLTSLNLLKMKRLQAIWRIPRSSCLPTTRW